MAATNLNLFDTDSFASSLSVLSINGASKRVAGVYVAPKTGNIRYVGVSPATVTTPGVMEVRVETVNASRFPSGTLYGTNTNATPTISTSNTYVWTQLTADAAVTAGDLLGAVAQFSATISSQFNYTGNMRARTMPFGLNDPNTGYVISQNPPITCLKYDDGTIVRGGLPIQQLTFSAVNSGSATPERATVFTVPCDCVISGAKVYLSHANASSTYSLNLYAGTLTTPTATVNVPANSMSTVAGSVGENVINFASPVSLTQGSTYRLSVRATDGTNNITIYRMTFLGTAERDATLGPMTSDTRAAGAWAGESTTTSEMIVPILTTLTPAAAVVTSSAVF